jgi:hypothetical protein
MSKDRFIILRIPRVGYQESQKAVKKQRNTRSTIVLVCILDGSMLLPLSDSPTPCAESQHQFLLFLVFYHRRSRDSSRRFPIPGARLVKRDYRAKRRPRVFTPRAFVKLCLMILQRDGRCAATSISSKAINRSGIDLISMNVSFLQIHVSTYSR